jgi:uncharacterized protein YwgA
MTQINTDLVSIINASFEISLSEAISLEELKQKLSLHINHLINHDFEKLVSLLYRVDVNENKMRRLLEQKRGEDAAGLIADLIIERQMQKIKSRRETKSNNDIPDDEKW